MITHLHNAERRHRHAHSVASVVLSQQHSQRVRGETGCRRAERRKKTTDGWTGRKALRVTGLRRKLGLAPERATAIFVALPTWCVRAACRL